MKGLTFVNEKVVKMNADSNQVETDSGTIIKYDYLVICPGNKLRFD